MLCDTHGYWLIISFMRLYIVIFVYIIVFLLWFNYSYNRLSYSTNTMLKMSFHQYIYNYQPYLKFSPFLLVSFFPVYFSYIFWFYFRNNIFQENKRVIFFLTNFLIKLLVNRGHLFCLILYSGCFCCCCFENNISRIDVWVLVWMLLRISRGDFLKIQHTYRGWRTFAYISSQCIFSLTIRSTW